jgi:hypothetical protein
MLVLDRLISASWLSSDKELDAAVRVAWELKRMNSIRQSRERLCKKKSIARQAATAIGPYPALTTMIVSVSRYVSSPSSVSFFANKIALERRSAETECAIATNGEDLRPYVWCTRGVLPIVIRERRPPLARSPRITSNKLKRYRLRPDWNNDALDELSRLRNVH